MIHFKHMGLYVSNLDREQSFYKDVFNMKVLVDHSKVCDELTADFLKRDDACITLSKLITERGSDTGVGDMLELIMPPKDIINDMEFKELYAIGQHHLGLGVDDIESVVMKIVENGGSKETSIHEMSHGNLCCFCRDPEGNWLELIQNGSK